MEIEVVRVTKFEGKNGFRGFATVKFTDGESSMTVNGFTIGETKNGKLIGKAPEQKGKNDGEYHPIVYLEGDFFWKTSDAIVAAYNDAGERTVADDKISTAKSKVDMAREEGVKTTVAKIGRFDPWSS